MIAATSDSRIHRPGLPPMPMRIAQLPVDAHGNPIPFSNPRNLDRCIAEGLCWLCGQRLGAYGTFVVGPVGAVSRETSEPPTHRECAEFAIQMAGADLGVLVVWVTKDWSRFRADAEATRIRLGDSVQVVAWCDGRAATEAEIFASLEAGMPALRATCDLETNEETRDRAHKALTSAVAEGCKALGVSLANYQGARL